MLGGRYTLTRRLDDEQLTSTWQAHDGTLERQVHLQAVASDHPGAEAMLDAARRAAAVEDSRLVRILDVGHDDAITYVVTEWLAAPSLTERLASGPLRPDDARTVVGEAALALEAARHRGLHHLRLTPDRVLVLDDGTVKITELATAAALDGADAPDDDTSSERATRQDTRDLIAIAYAALTATWPLDGESGLPAAPRVSGRPVAPAQIVTGAPADLDTLCAQTFAGAGAPDSPGDLAGQIAPWGRQRRDERAHGVFPHALAPTKRPPLPTAPPPTPAGRPAPAATNAEPEARAEPKPAPPPEPEAERQPVPVPQPDSRREAGSTSDVHESSAVGPTGVLPVVQAPEHGVLDDFALYRDAPGDEPDEPEAEVNRTRTVLVIVGIFVAVFLLLAYCGLRGLGKNAFVPSHSTTPKPSAAATTPPPSSETSQTTTPSQTSTGPIAISSGSGFDPQGDHSEKDADAGKAFDGKTSTSWTSDTYKTAAFGGLKKGVGLRLDLGGVHEVHQVKVTLGLDGGTVQLRTADGDQLGKVLDTASDASGTVTLTPKQPVSTGDVVIWFTDLPAASDGGYRADVAEVEVS